MSIPPKRSNTNSDLQNEQTMKLFISYPLFLVVVGVAGSIAATASLTEAAPVRHAAATTPQQEAGGGAAAAAVTEKSSDPSPSRVAVPATTHRPTVDPFDYDYYYYEDDDDGLDGDYYYYYTEGTNVYAEVPPKPTHRPSKSPTKQSTKSPTKTLTRKPSRSPTQRLTNRPSFKPSEHPSPRPSPLPTNKNVDAEIRARAIDLDATTGSSKSKKSAKSGKKTSRKL